MKNRICQVPGCDTQHYGKGYCHRHWLQMKKCGKIFGNPQRTYRDPNEFIVEGDICKIQLYDTYGNVKTQAIIDTEELSLVKNQKWGLCNGYVRSRSPAGEVALEYVILGIKRSKSIRIDHRDGNPLKNSKHNLRICTFNQNVWNSTIPKNNTSGFKGVSWDSSRSRWIAQIGFNRKLINLGRFKLKIQGARAYNEAALRLHGEFGRLNKIANE